MTQSMIDQPKNLQRKYGRSSSASPKPSPSKKIEKKVSKDMKVRGKAVILADYCEKMSRETGSMAKNPTSQQKQGNKGTKSNLQHISNHLKNLQNFTRNTRVCMQKKRRDSYVYPAINSINEHTTHGGDASLNAKQNSRFFQGNEMMVGIQVKTYEQSFDGQTPTLLSPKILVRNADLDMSANNSVNGSSLLSHRYSNDGTIKYSKRIRDTITKNQKAALPKLNQANQKLSKLMNEVSFNN